MKQMAYARRILGGQGKTKQQIALDAGYSTHTANSVSYHIESKKGFHNAMAALAVESNNLALAAMHEFKARGFEGFSNKELIGALNAIGSAWSRFNTIPNEKKYSESKNRLRTVVLQQLEADNLPVREGKIVEEPPKQQSKVEVADVEKPMDF